MTKADAARLVAIVVTAYPNFDKFKDAKAIEATVNLWAMMFEQDEIRDRSAGSKKTHCNKQMAAKSGRSPGDHAEIQHPELIEPDKAWLAVSDLMYSAGQFNHGDLSTSSRLSWRGPLSQSAGLPSGKCTAAHT